MAMTMYGDVNMRHHHLRGHKKPYQPSKQILMIMRKGKFARKVRRRATKL